MKENSCIFCFEKNIIFSKISNREYGLCKVCGGIFVKKTDFISENAQKKRYLLHNNDLNNAGYKKFLENFINPVLEFLKKQNKITLNFSIFDFGSGVKPCLCELLHHYCVNGLLPSDTQINMYDKFFASEKPFIESDLCVCLETIEHFENLESDLQNLSNCVKKGGYCAIGTNLVPEATSFEKWWYKEDSTHVCFFTIPALKACLSRVNLSFVDSLSDRIFIFQKF